MSCFLNRGLHRCKQMGEGAAITITRRITIRNALMIGAMVFYHNHNRARARNRTCLFGNRFS